MWIFFLSVHKSNRMQNLFRFAFIVIFYVFAIDFSESLFPNTRKVQIIHNFPDILRKVYPNSPTFITHVEAGYSAVKCLILPFLVGILLFWCFGTATKLKYCTFLVTLGFTGILSYLFYVGVMNVTVKNPFFIHGLMYAIGFGCFFILLCPFIQRE